MARRRLLVNFRIQGVRDDHVVKDVETEVLAMPSSVEGVAAVNSTG